MTTTQAGPKISVGTAQVEPFEVSTSPPGNLRGTVTTTELGQVDQSRLPDPGKEGDSGIDGLILPDVQHMSVVPPRPPPKPMNPDHPIRYIPIHIWPEHLKKVQPRTGRRYYPKRSRTMPKRNGSSPLVREYQYTEDESEDQGLSDTETTRSCDAECAGTSAIRSTVKRRGWRYALLGAVQNAVPKRPKEDKNLHTVVPRRPLSLTPFRFSHHPPGLRIRESRESLER